MGKTAAILTTADAIPVGRSGHDRWASAFSDQAEAIHTLVDDAKESMIPDGPLSRLGLALASGAAWAYFKTCAAVFKSSYVHEIEAIAAEVGVHAGDLVLANSIYDITQRAACSSVSFVQGRRPLLVRTLDWAQPATIGRFTTVYHVGDCHGGFYSVGIPGFVGALSTMRPNQWAMTINLAPSTPGSSNTLLPRMPTLVRIREACESSRSFDALVKRLTLCDPDTPFTAHVIGTSPSDMAVVEHSRSSVLVRTGKLLAATNHFPDTPTEDEESVRRYNCALRRGSKPRASPCLALAAFVRPPILRADTQQSMVLDPAHGRLEVHALGR